MDENHDPLRLVRGRTAPSPRWCPEADLYRTTTGWLVKLDLAGVDPRQVELTMVGNRLTVRGSRRDQLVEQGCEHYLLEITYSSFERSLELPVKLEATRLRTEYREGMFLVFLDTEQGNER